MKKRALSTCPIVFSLDTFGDKWSLVILRDILFGGKSHFREFLASPEKIASNILAARLDSLVHDGMLSKTSDPANKSAAIYKPTQKAIDLLPMLTEMLKWGVAHSAYADKNNPDFRSVLTDPQGSYTTIVQKFS
jgi:DNA-binding HxlR family transcriptional regulator